MALIRHPNVNSVAKWIVLIALSAALLLMLMPFILVTINSVKTEAEFGLYGPLSLPHSLNFTSLIDFWNRVNFTQVLINSTYISLAVAISGVLLSLLNALPSDLERYEEEYGSLCFF